MSAKVKQNSPPRERLFLLDGMALAYRAYFSFINRPLINSRGENTSAIFGFVNALMKILNEDTPEHIAVVFDTKEPTFRHVMYDQYKATREKMPEDMAGQIDKLKEHSLAQFKIKRRQRLIKQKYFRFINNGTRQSNPLLLPSRKLLN